jgi:hypothetical protein
VKAQKSYDPATISPDLMQHAAYVMREESMVLEIQGLEKVRWRVHRVLTVLNEKGKQAASFLMATDKFIRLADFEMKEYNRSGVVVAKHKMSDLKQAMAEAAFIEDSRFYFYIPAINTYPTTIEYSFELQIRGSLFYPPFEVLGPDESLEHADYTVVVKKDLDFRYKEKNLTLQLVVSDDGRSKTYLWAVSHLPAVPYEEGSSTRNRHYPTVLLAPNRFKLDDYEGDMTSWDSFGRWYADLAREAGKLPPERARFFQQLVQGAPDDKEKVRIIYRYLQENFRYVSIQLGIGGFRPFAADFTDQKKYGDCKALSNFMQAALGAVGIKAYQALVNAGENQEPVDPDFPCNLFNHVIICVPFRNDSVWLECTSRISDFGVLGSFTENRNALLVTENGGKLTRTPKSTASGNVLHLYSEVTVDDGGTGKSNTVIYPTGEFKRHLVGVFYRETNAQKEYFVNYYGFRNGDNFTIQRSDSVGLFFCKVNMDLEKVPEMLTQKSMFIPPRVWKIDFLHLPPSAGRKMDYYFEFPFDLMDTTVLKLPEGYSPADIPQDKSFSSAFGSFTCTYRYNSKSRAIWIITRFTVTDSRIPADKYAEVKQLFEHVSQENSDRIVISRP